MGIPVLGNGTYVKSPNLEEKSHVYNFLQPIDELSLQDIQEKACQIYHYSIFENLIRQLARHYKVPYKLVSSREGVCNTAYRMNWINEETYNYWAKKNYVKKGNRIIKI